jgi:hypothetical protein
VYVVGIDPPAACAAVNPAFVKPNSPYVRKCESVRFAIHGATIPFVTAGAVPEITTRSERPNHPVVFGAMLATPFDTSCTKLPMDNVVVRPFIANCGTIVP